MTVRNVRMANPTHRGQVTGTGPVEDAYVIFEETFPGKGIEVEIWDETAYVGYADTLEAYDPEHLEGEQAYSEWDKETAGRVRTPPTVSDGMGVLGCDEGAVHGVSDVGWLRWEFTAEDAVATPPAVVHDGSDDSTGTVYVGSEDHHVYAINQSDGTEQWRFETGGRVLSGPAVVDGTVYVGSYDKHVSAIASPPL